MSGLTLPLFFSCFGLCIGSFLNAVIFRLPRKIPLSRKRSHCPQCDKVINWYENIPLFSYLFLRGKCSQCGFKIPIQYPMVEFIVGVFAFFIAPDRFEINQMISFWYYLSIFAAFVAIFVIDLKHKIIPNELNIFLALMFFGSAVMTKPYYFWLIGGLVGLFIPLSMTYLFYFLKGQVGMGGGDIKLYAVLGLTLGPLGVMHNITISCLIGAIFSGIMIGFKLVDKNTPIPFGPFIVITASIQIFFPGFLESSLSSLV